MSELLAPDETLRLRRPLRLRRLALSVAAIALLAGAAWAGNNWWQTGRFMVGTDDAYVGGDVTPIAPHVAGFVAQILVCDNQYVRAGQPLVTLQGQDFAAAVAHARAILAEREADLTTLQAQRTRQAALVAGAADDLAAKQADAAFDATDAARYARLAQSAAGSRQEAERARTLSAAAKAAVAAAKAAQSAAEQQLAVLATQIAGGQAAVKAAVADLQTAQLNVGYTVIRAPIDGYVGNRAAEPGAYVSAGSYLLSIVPARGLWVDANFKEDELAHMKPGEPARIVTDILPGRVFAGHVVSLAPASGAVFSVIPAENATGNFTKIVQRVPVRIALDGQGAELGLLRPGLSATVTVDTKPAS